MLVFRSSSFVALSLLLAVASSDARAQLEAPADRLDRVEEEIAKLEDEIAKLRADAKKAKKEEEEEGIFADGIELVGGTRLRLGGKLELNFHDAESDTFAPLGAAGSTAEPDPWIELQRFRLAPQLELNRHFSIQGQIDFEPRQGETILKEMTVRHDIRPAWWFRSRVQVGVDDRFIRPDRRTKMYPLIGTAFWRDESLAITWGLRFGDADGRPAEKATKAERDGARSGAGAEAASSGADGSAGTDGGSDGERSGAEYGAFDFAGNPGQLELSLSIGQGYALGTKEVTFDRADMNALVQDDRDLETDLSLRELGIGLGYRRNFRALGELGASAFYFDDELRDVSVLFLQQDLTVRDPGGNATAGYGDSGSRKSFRYGADVSYFLAAEHIFGETFDTRKGDGLRLYAQAITAEDGDLEREGWFAQASYRFSFGRLIADRYLRSLEPIVRYGTLQVNVAPDPTLPGTWDRKQLFLGAILEVTGDIFFKFEYAMNDESTGAPQDVGNDEFLAQLLIEF